MQPKGMRFETQGSGETILLFLRRHPATNVPWIAAGGLFFLLPLVGIPLFPQLGRFFSAVSPGFQIALILMWYLFTGSYLFVNFLLWYFSVSLVTNRRIIDIDFQNILYKEFSATTIDKIEDVTDRRGGFFGALFDYGDVFIQTAATKEAFEFLSVPHPDAVVRIVNELMGQRKHSHG